MSDKPTAGGAEALGQLSPAARQVLLQNILRERTVPVLETIPRRASRGPAPLSFAQQRLWLVHKLEPDSPAYNVPHALRLRGELDPEALRRSLGELVRRHEALRTVFRERDGEPVQVVGPALPVELPLVDLRGLPDAEREAERRVRAEALRPFDLERGPVLRSTLLRLGDDDHVLSFTLHHIVSDGWSSGVLVREVSALHAAFSRGEEARLPELPIQYADFAVWQREWLSGERLERQVAYWKERLAGAPSLLELPTDRPRSAAAGARAAGCGFVLDAALAVELRALARREGTTIFSVLAAGFAALLSRWTGQDDVVIGTPVAGRTHVETEGLIGFFINMLALRADLAGEPGARELVAQMKARVMEAHAHQDLPFERLVDELRVERSRTHAPLVQAVLSFNAGTGGGGGAPGSDGALRLGGVSVQPMSADGETAKFDLALGITDAGEWLGGSLMFRADLWETATIERMAGHLRSLLAGMAREPERSVAELPLMDDAELEQLLHAWSATRAEDPGPCLHERFAAQAARTPLATAVVFEDRSLSYAQLHAGADRLARHLRARGVHAETRVALCAERSPELIVGILGILAAGGVYVPVDPVYPADRIAYLLEDSGCAAVLVQAPLRSRIPPAAAQVLTLEDALADEAPDEGAPAAVRPDNAAYVIYTSGSTGRPKGVVVTHANVARLFQATDPWFGFGAQDVWTLFHSYAFDFSVWEIWGALLHGGRLVVVPWETSRSPEQFHDLLVREGVTVLSQTPSAFRQLDAVEQARGVSPGLALRLVVFGGEALEPRTLRGWLERHGAERPRLVNMYGITETTVHVTYRPLGWEEVESAGASPIGTAIPDLGVRVLDGWGNPVPVGVPGELYVGGGGVARGYLGRAELTAERFVPDAYSAEPGARVYRTGDRVRWLASGELEYLGRMDRQVKIRGFRIEPGEVEAALAGLAGVREAVVVVREDAAFGVPAEKRLVAYVVAAEAGGVTGAGLREELGSRLPEHMVPGVFVVLEQLPLTSHGKVDRGALPAPEPAADPGSPYVAPRTPAEEVLAGIWAEVLGVERVGTEEDFFALGGHSLLATRVVARARQAFGVEVPLREFFETPTVAALAALVEELRGAGALPAPPMERASRAEPLPLSFAQQRLWLVDRIEPGSPAYNMHFPLRLRGALDAAALRASLDALVARHETLRTTFAEHDGLPVQVVHPPAPAALRIIDLQDVPEAEREAERLAAEEALRPFDLARGPLLRCTLLRLADDDHVLCLTMHHVVSDGWSMQVLVREVSAVYAAYSRGEEAPLAELPVQYADFAVWQRAWLSGAPLEERIGYWKAQLAGAPALLEVATDHPREPGQSTLAASHPLRLSPELSRELRALSRREGATLFMTVLAGWQALLSRYSGQTDVTVGTPVAGRTRTELEGLIGFFVNMLVLRGDLGGDPTWSELLRRTRDTALGAYDHQELPFERLVEELGVQRSLLHSPVFQTTFALEPDAGGDGRREPGPVRLEPFGGGERAAKFDLDLAMADDGEALGGAIVYRRALFEPETIARMAGHLEAVLEAMAAGPAGRLSDLRLLRGAERARVLEAWNATAAELPRACVHELFAGQAAHTPAAVAIVAGEETVTYAELERRANRLAHLLRGRGAGPESRVGVCLERGIPAVLAILATLKAGAAYVPVAPADPAERLREVFADAGVRLVLTDAAAGAQLPDSVEPLWLDAPETAAGLLAMPETAPEVPSDPAQLAYVIYTSGSTGRPKGVAVAHASVVRLVRGTSYVSFGPEERIAHASNLAFDAATFEIWGALLNGGSLAVVEREVTLSPAALAAALREREATALFVTTALFNRVAHEAPDAFATLRHLLFGGEAVDPQAVRRVLEHGAPRRLLHVYGPTETTTYASWQRVREVAPDAATVPIGAGLGNTTLYVLAAGGEALPVGVPGELYIGGAGLARGYLGQPAMTAERFVPDPFGAAGARLYRTGDRVRWTAAGEIEYLGRMDQQVKIRGFRIEPSEVEAVLTGMPEVREAVVAVREDAPGEKRLAAYVVAAEGAEVTGAGLRAQLAARLPEYLVPGAVVVLDALPLNANGKVDRGALPAPQWGSGAEYVAPRTATEEVLAGIWVEVLKLERVGVEASFFDLGGHSLLATQVVSRARQAFGTEVPLRALFEAPTVAGLARRIEALRSAGVEAAPRMERVERTGPMPVSFAQQRLWVVDRLEPGSATYNMPYALRLRGALDVGALRASLDALVERHETLRTVFAEHEGRPVQVIHPPALVALTELDLRDRPEAEREAAAERLATEEGLFPFDLAQGPLLRSTLLRLGEQDHVLCFTLHHVVSDGWSMQVLVREVSALYAAFSRREKPRLPELPVQYADFAVWQREWLSGEVLEAQIGFWKTQLSGAPPLLEVPTDRPRGKGSSPHAARQHFEVPPATARALRALARREGATLFMTVLAAWQSLLARYSGQDDLVVGSPIAGRNRREIEGLIGFFVNMLALRGDLSGNPTWTELLGRVRETALAAYDHQELPFERLVEELAVERSLVHTPVFQAIYSLNRVGGREERLSLDEVRLEPFGTGEGLTKFDLNLAVVEGEEWLGASLAYRTGLFDAETASRMAGHLETLLEAMAADPARRLSETSLLRGPERAHLLHAWNGADAGYTGELCVHELVRAQVLRTPDAPALRFQGQRLTYAELFRRSCQLANRLRREGVGPEVRVGICMDPAREMVVSVLGVLLAGGAYLPLDPELPAERRAYVLRDAAPVLLLTQSALAERLEDWGVPLLRVDAEAGRIACESDEAPATGVDPDNLAYIIYTSGSTGRPKGVLCEHRGVGNTFLELGRVYGAAPGERNLAYAPLFFDASVADIFTALCNGAELVLARREAMMPGEDLARLLGQERITHLKIMPSALTVTPVEPLPELKVIVTGGEVLAAELVRRWTAEGRRFFNGYGATEAGIRMTSSPYSWEGGDPPIGRAVANTQLYALDAQLEPVPVGMPGELYIGGVGVMRGYLGRPDLTAERFLPDPHRGVAGARLYRTGDLGRRRADGEIDFLGRTDHQVKVRGYRVELGEIEAVLRGDPGVREATVLLREDVPGQQRLVAYVTAREGAEPTAAELRTGLAERVPEYMVPSSFVILEQLPVTANGKIDRRALPAPERTEEGAYVAPRTVVEELLAGIWAEVLGTERVGATENFFELGGHSLLATQIASRTRQILGVEVQVRAVFEAPTPAAMAERVEALRSAGASLAPAIERVPRTEALPVSFAQQRLWLVDRLDPGSAAYNMPYALHLHGALDVAAMRATLDELVRRHETLRTVFAERGGVPVQVIRDPVPVPLPVVDLRGVMDAEGMTGRLVDEEAMQPFDLERGPLLRSTLLRLGETHHALCFTLHHIVSDGWSRSVLVHEVSALYAQFSRGGKARLPEPPVQYADYAVWQRSWLTGDVLDAQIEYWKTRLSEAPPLLDLATDRPRAVGLSPHAASHGFGLSAELSNRLRALSRQQGATLFMTLLAGWQALLARYSGQEDLVVGSPIAGRTRPEVERLIGFFVNMLALRADLSGDPTWTELLERVRAEMLRAYDHQELPFDRLVEELGVERSLTHSPVFQTIFTLNLPYGSSDRLELGGLRIEPFDGADPIAKFDLDLVFTDGGGALGGALVYRRALFDAGTMERMAEHLVTLLEAMAADPGRRVAELSLLSAAERVQVLDAWNATARAYPRDLRLHDLFAAQAGRTPDAPALVFEGQALTYAELDAGSNRLSRLLRRHGVGPETRVAISLERGPGMVLAVLGVLKAGGAYVPLDPAYPVDHAAYVLADSGAALVLTQTHLAASFATGGVPLLALDALQAELAVEPAEAAESGAAPDNLAYVIYTSGSTGQPKGVGVQHRSVVNYTYAARDFYRLTARDRVIQFHSLSFDVSVEEIFITLLAGAALVLRDDEMVGSAARFFERCEEWGITVLEVPAAYWHELAAALDRGEARLPGCVRLAAVGGERMLPERVAQWRRLVGDTVELVNAYGPTEATITATMSRVGEGVLSIGGPIANMRTYVLEPTLEPAPVGVPGELWIGGAGVARGYLGRPEATAERFTPDPFCREAGARMYRSGDRVRWLATGELDYLGRLDEQVKVRGFRIELGEIEVVLRGHQTVEEAVVVVRKDASGDGRIVAYVTPAGGAAADPAELRAYAGRQLPEYMVPSALVVLEVIPRTPSGKTDRRALPAPTWTGGGEGDGAPRDELEMAITEIFGEVLNVPAVGLRDSFFDLGGHSLLAVQLMSRLEKALGVRIPMASLFRAPTVELLAEEVRRGGGGTPLLVPMRFGRGRAPLFLVHPGGGNLMAYVGLVKELDAEQPVFGLRSRGIEYDETPNWTVEEMARDYLAAIREVAPSGPYRLGGWSLGGVIAFEMARQLEAAGETVEPLLLIDSRSPRLDDPDGPARSSALQQVRRFAEDLGLPGDRLPLPEEEQGDADEVAYLREVLVAARLAGLVPEALDLARMQHLYGVFKINVQAMQDYRPGSYGGRIVLLRARKRTLSQRLFRSRTFGWERVATGGVEVLAVPGTHYSMLREPHAAALAREIERALG